MPRPAIPPWIAFVLARRKPTPTFTYGHARVEDLAGLAVVAVILFSALVAGYQAIDRFIHPQEISALGRVAVAGVLGFIGNEAVAVFRIRVGREMNSTALIADGYHARNWATLVSVLPLGIVFGAIHALIPGHGKSVLASYLVGSRLAVWRSRDTRRDACGIGCHPRVARRATRVAYDRQRHRARTGS
jgi:cation diffusion facilitator family transporter